MSLSFFIDLIMEIGREKSSFHEFKGILFVVVSGVVIGTNWSQPTFAGLPSPQAVN